MKSADSSILIHGCPKRIAACDFYGCPLISALNLRGTMFVDTKDRRISMEDRLDDGETITSLVGIVGG